MLEAIIASIGYAGGIISDKLILSKYKVPVGRFMPLVFIWLATITAIFIPIWGKIEMSELLTTRYGLVFFGMIVVAVVWNVYYTKGLQREEMHEFELIMMMSPLFTVIFAEIFLPQERSFHIFVAALIASGALIATRFRRHHLRITKTSWMTMLAMVLMSFESILIKDLLSIASPVTLYFMRTFFVAVVFIISYRPKLFTMCKEAYALVLISAIFGVTQMVLKFYGFQNLGVVETTMILVSGPFLVYFFSALYFKEKLFKRDIFAAAVVVGCILYVTFR